MQLLFIKVLSQESFFHLLFLLLPSFIEVYHIILDNFRVYSIVTGERDGNSSHRLGNKCHLPGLIFPLAMRTCKRRSCCFTSSPLLPPSSHFVKEELKPRHSTAFQGYFSFQEVGP